MVANHEFRIRRLSDSHTQLSTIAPAVVVRMAKLYGPDSPFYESFETWMRVRFERMEQLLLFSDQYRSLIYVGDEGVIVKCCVCRRQAATSSSRTPLTNFTFLMTSPRRR